MTGEGTPVKKFVSRYHSKNWGRQGVTLASLDYSDIKIVKDNQPTDDLSVDYAFK